MRTSTVLSEHNRVIAARHYLALFNFLVILAGSVVTQYFLSVRGVPQGVLILADVVIAVNVIQFGLCLADHITKKYCGLYVKALVPISYVVGVLWLILLALILVFSTLAAGIFRIDLAAIVGVQVVTAFVAYLLWSLLDRRALDAMMRSSIRDDEAARAKKATGYVVFYILLAFAVLAAQGGALFLYRIPPKLYDLFDESRALGYELSSDGKGYVVNEIYSGTSSFVNIPATYNDLPVIGIKSGALDEGDVREREKVRTITFGSPIADEEGNVSVVSYLEYIDSGAIVNGQIETLTLPASLTRIGGYATETEAGVAKVRTAARANEFPPAIVSSSLKTLIYQAQANFELFDYDCAELRTITMSGASVGPITSVDGLSAHTTIEVSKDIYNAYRKDNIAYVHNFRPLIAENEFCVDFYTDCDVYIDSIIASSEQTVGFDYLSGLTVDTAAYNADPHELGTNGAKLESAFRGWYTDASFFNEYKIATDSSLRFNKSMELYAKWVHEYTAELDWGNHKPAGVEDIQHWTDERSEDLPRYTERQGYSAGVSWHVGNKDGDIVQDTHTLHSDVVLCAEWLLDAPKGIDIKTNPFDSVPEVNGGVFVSEDENSVSFVYDEKRYITLASEKGEHPLEAAGGATTYDYTWRRATGAEVTTTGTVPKLQNVADTDTYILRVTVTAVLGGESAWAETSVLVSIDRKPLGLTDNHIDMKSKKVTYDATVQTIEIGDPDGAIDSMGVLVNYEYRDAESSASLGKAGVRDAGTYNVFATIRKASENDRANYEETTLNATLEIAPKALSKPTWKGEGEGWSGNSVTYDGKEHTFLFVIDPTEICGSDSVHFTYEEGSNRGTDADKYTAKVKGLDNPNYSYDLASGVEKEWTITPKSVTVLHWEIDGTERTSVDYSGTLHTVKAILSGNVMEDVVRFEYKTTAPEVVSATKAGDYLSQISGVDNSNYTFDTEGGEKATFRWKINKKNLVIAINADTYTYTGTEQGATARVTGFVGSEAQSFRPDFFSYTAVGLNVTGSVRSDSYELRFVAIDADTYTVTFSGLNTGLPDEVLANYTVSASGSTMTREFTIGQKQLTFDPNYRSYTYNGTAQELYLAVNGIVARDLNSVTLAQFGTTATSGKTMSGVYCLVYSGTNADNYPVRVQSFENDNYKFEEYNGQIAISKQSISIGKWLIQDNSKEEAAQEFIAGASFFYNFYGYTVSVELTGVVHSEDVKLKLESATGKNAESYTTSATLPAEYENYTLVGENSVGWSIKPYVLDFTWKMNGAPISSSASYVYNGELYTVTASCTPLGTDSVTPEYSSVLPSNKTSEKNVGTYTAEVASTGNANYTVGENETCVWKITPAPVTVTFTPANGLTYNGKYQGPSFTMSGLMAVDSKNITIRANASGSTLASASVSKDIDFAYTGSTYSFTDTYGFAVDAGSYSVRISSIRLSGADSNNYSLPSSGTSTTFTIAQKTLSLTGEWTYSNGSAGTGKYLSNTTLTYNKQMYTLTTEIVSGGLVARLGTKADTVTLVYSGNSATNYNATGYTAEVTALSGEFSSNYKLPTSGLRCNWSIAKKNVTFTWSNSSVTYTGSELRVSANYSTGASTDNDNKVYAGDSLSLTYTGASATTVGTYTAKVTNLGNNNYTFNSSDASASHSWTIQARPVELTWTDNSFVYNGLEQYPTAEWTYSGITVHVTTYEKPAGGSKNASTSEYTIKATALDNDNFTLVNGQNVSHNYTITKKTLDLVWVLSGSGTAVSGYSFVYTGNAFTLAARATNLCGSDTVTFAYSTTNKETFTDAGRHTSSVSSISGGTNSSNYQLGSNTSVTVEVKPQPVTVRWNASSKSVVYDGKEHNEDFTVTLSGTKQGRTYTVPSSVSVSGTATTAKNQGSYTYSIAIAGEDANNFTLTGVSDVTRTLTITRKPVTISWQCDGKPVTGNLSTFTYYYGQSHSVNATVSGTYEDGITATYSAATTVSNAGRYEIRVTGLSGTGNGNYTVDGVSNTTYAVQINKQNVRIEWKAASGDSLTQSTVGKFTRVYDGNSHKPTATVQGVDDGHTVSSSSVTVSGNAISNVGSETFTLSLSGTEATNYELGTTNTSCTLTVTPATATVSWGTTEFRYTASSHTVSYTVYDKTNGSTVKSSFYNFNGTAQTDAGSYEFTLKLITDNYVLEGGGTEQKITMKIKPAIVTVVWGDTEFEEDGEEHSIKPQFTVEPTVSVEGHYSFNGVGKTGQGTYHFTLTLTSTNFAFDEEGTRVKTVTMTITAKAEPASIRYDISPDFKRMSV